jgi:hypothetical protein
MVALTLLGPAISWSWYMLWYIPLGAVLAGTRESDFVVTASAAAVLTYAIFPWIEGRAFGNLFYLTLVPVLPALYVWCVEPFSLPSTRGREFRETGVVAAPG